LVVAERKLYSVSEIKDVVCGIAINYPINKVTLFGSYAKGEAREGSDIDLLIDSGGALRGLQFFGVVGDIADKFEPTEVDVIEAREVIKGSRVDAEIAAAGVVLYAKG
jgi:predicted nucleotidyltransferase